MPSRIPKRGGFYVFLGGIMVKYKGKEIIYSLRYGGFMPAKARVIISIPFIALFFILLILTICLNIDRGGFLTDSDTIAFFVFMFVSLLILLIFPILHLRKTKIEKKYKLWLADENLVEAYAKPFITSENYSRGSKYHRFGIKFNYNSEKIVRYSNHYDNVILLYRDKCMRLVYSPRYDEVLIVENE